MSVVVGPVDPDDSADEDSEGQMNPVSVVAGPADPDDSADEDSESQMNL